MTEDFEKRTQEILEESAGRLDGRTRSRLTQARHAALAQLRSRRVIGGVRMYQRARRRGGGARAGHLVGTAAGYGADAGRESVDDLELLADAEGAGFRRRW
jgi:hypothetical protein